MDVFTNPDWKTYMVGKTFLYPSEMGDILAISASNSVARTLNTVYTILTIYLFMKLWTSVLYMVMLFTESRCELSWNLFLVAFWNSAEPIAAFINLIVHFVRLWFITIENKGYTVAFKNKSIRLGGKLTLLALVFAALSIAGGILIPPMLILDRPVAPVNPETVWLPMITGEGRVDGATSQWSTLFSGAAIRAVGSAEASKVTLREKVNVTAPEVTTQSTNEKPSFIIRYNYNLTGVEMGIAHRLGFVHSVQGQCRTEYGWLQHYNSTPLWDGYVPWNASKFDIPTPSNKAINIRNKLGLFAPMFADHVEQLPTNMSYALIYQTAHLPSFTESGDVMYMTERMPANDTFSTMFSFRVMAGRPALSCWHESLFCIHGNCGRVDELARKGFPPGLNMILSSLSNPAVIDMVSRLGPSALMSFYSSIPGTSVDAATSTTFKDLERIVLGSYLYTKNIFRDSTMMQPSESYRNLVVNGRGKTLRGTGDFVLESKEVTALSFAVLITLPTIAFFALFTGTILSRFAHPNSCLPGLRRKRARLVDLSAPNLYRLANDLGGGVDGAKWSDILQLHPVPKNLDAKACMPFLNMKVTKLGSKEHIEYSNVQV